MMAFLSLQGCSDRKAPVSYGGEKIEMRHAGLLRLEKIDDDVTLATVRSPWDSTRNLGVYALVANGREIDFELPAGTQVIDVPVKRSVVYSGIHTALLDELGALYAVQGACDVSYITDSATNRAIAAGKILDCGSNTSPVMERIISLRPEVVILSPFEKSDDLARFSPLGINVLEAADYMEKTPLGRAEWIRLFGRLYGKGEKADSLFNAIERDYLALREKGKNAATRPTVLFDRLYSGVWNVPTSGSVTGIMIEDAGGSNPFSKYKDGGAAHLTAEEVLHTARNADIWLIRYSEPALTLSSISADNPVYSQFDAFDKGNVYGANTLTSYLFEDGAFHPEKVLREMLRIFHPEIEKSPTVYYKRINN